MHGGRHRLILVALLSAALPVLTAGCSFESEIVVQLLGDSPVVVKQSTKVDVTPQRVRGTTTRAGQVVRIDCSITGIYDVDDPTGPAVLVQLYVVHLRTRPLPRGTPYQLDCAGPVIVELPTDASDIHATATDATGLQMALPVQAPLTSLALASGKRLRAEPGMHFALVGQPSLVSRRAHGRAHLQPLRGPLVPGEGALHRLRSRAAARNTCSRSARSSPPWRARGHSRSSRRERDQRARPAPLWRHRRLPPSDANAFVPSLSACRLVGSASPRDLRDPRPSGSARQEARAARRRAPLAP